jgi:hypothetical protein
MAEAMIGFIGPLVAGGGVPVPAVPLAVGAVVADAVGVGAVSVALGVAEGT